MAVKLREHSIFLFVDDKVNIPVGKCSLVIFKCCLYFFVFLHIGEPNHPIATGVRGRQHAIVPHDGPTLTALDHDFYLAGITPSVAFLSSIPGSIDDSFFNGKVTVTVKDKVLQPSCPLRHAAELNRIIFSQYADAIPPIMFLYS